MKSRYSYSQNPSEIPNEQPVLSVRNLTQRLLVNGKPKILVNNLSFDLFKGKTLAIVGESGSGKTVTAHSLVRIHNEPPFLPPEGEVFYENQNLLSLAKFRLRKIRGKKIAMIFQNPVSAINPVYTIGFQLLEVVTAHLKLKGEVAKNLILQAFRDVQLPNPEAHFEQYPHQLSGGMLQRVMIASALVTSPDILIADEPTTALDVTIQKQILILLKELQLKKNMAILIITHDFGVVAEIADDVVVMYQGEIVEKGESSFLFDNPQHDYTKSLLSYHFARESR